MFEAHDVNGDQMLSSLRLRIGLVTGHKEQGCVHDGRTSEHGRHEGIMTWAIDKGDVPIEDKGRVAHGTVSLVRLG